MSKRIVLFGATGLAGGGVLRACLAAPEIARVVAVVRRPLEITSPKLREVRCEQFDDLSPIAADLADIDACFYCLGIASSGIAEARYRTITKDYALAAARALRAASPEHTFHFISGNGTNTKSHFMWARVKAETEEALKAFGLAGIVCWRPAMILADHPPSNLPWIVRTAYPVLRLARGIRSLAVEADALGFAMIQEELESRKEGTLDNAAIRAAADRYRAQREAR